MILTYEQAVKIIKEPDADLISELKWAKVHDDRCFLHTEPENETARIHALPEFLQWIRAIIDEGKYDVFCHLLRTPVPTVEIVNGIVDEIKKIFEAQDRHISFDFSTPELTQDFEEYRKKINEINFWHTLGFQKMKSSVNDFLVIDLPSEQKGNSPEPYFYFVRPEYVKGTQLKPDGSLEYLIFWGANNYWYIFDDSGVKIISSDEPYVLISEVKHDLGYTTARPFWTTPYNKNKLVQKQSPITKSLSTIDWLLASKTFGNHLVLYNAFPILVTYEQKCTYADSNGNYCSNGVIVVGYNDTAIGGQAVGNQTMPCPACSARQNTFGPGTHITAPAPASKEDPDIIGGVNFVAPDVKNLEWLTSNIDDQIAWITYNVIGRPEEVTTQAQNEKQVMSSFESRMNVMANVRENFEAIQKFTDDTLARLRYGAKFTGSIVSYGKNVMLYTATEMQQQYQDGKKNGDPMYELSAQRKAIIEAKYKNNPEMKQRMTILGMIEPYADMSITDINLMMRYSGVDQKTNLIDEKFLKLKINLDNYIARFERENMDIVSFMKFAPLDIKIDYILESIFGYIDEETPEDSTVGVPDPAAPDPSKPAPAPAPAK